MGLDIEVIVLASHNKKKLGELRSLLEPLGIALRSLAEYPGAQPPEETGATFEDNAVIKAAYAASIANLPALADDSGLMVDSLHGEPGVYSARFAGENATDETNNQLLLARMARIPREQRRACFVSVIALAMPDGEVRTWRGETAGRILEAPLGEHGFGYDPLFLSDDLGKTFAQTSQEEKNRVSHRARALQAFIAELARKSGA